MTSVLKEKTKISSQFKSCYRQNHCMNKVINTELHFFSVYSLTDIFEAVNHLLIRNMTNIQNKAFEPGIKHERNVCVVVTDSAVLLAQSHKTDHGKARRDSSEADTISRKLLI